jgi:hypothetical protein
MLMKQQADLQERKKKETYKKCVSANAIHR